MNLSEKAQTGLVALWPKMMDAHYSDIIKKIPSITNTSGFGENSLFNDFMKIFTDKNGNLHMDLLEESLEKYADVYKAGAKFQILGYDIIHGPISYRYYDSRMNVPWETEEIKFKEYFMNNRTIGGLRNPVQVTIEDYSLPEQAVDGLQIDPKWTAGNCKLRIVIDNNEIKDNIFLSFSGKSFTSNYIEACTRSYPEYGAGGAMQVEFPHVANVKHLEYFDEINNIWKRVY